MLNNNNNDDDDDDGSITQTETNPLGTNTNDKFDNNCNLSSTQTHSHSHLDLEKQGSSHFPSSQVVVIDSSSSSSSSSSLSEGDSPALLQPNPTVLSIIISSASDSHVIQISPSNDNNNNNNKDDDLPTVDSPKKVLSRTQSSHDQCCRVCQQEKEEALIILGCKCKGGLAKAHRSCIDTWFHTKGSNKCEICQEVAVNVSPPESHPSANYWVWRIDPTFRPRDPERGCFSPLWVAFSILIGGLLLDVLISITLGVSALPVNIIIGVIVVLGLGTALRLALEFCHEWSFRRVVQRVDSNVPLGYHPAL